MSFSTSLNLGSAQTTTTFPPAQQATAVSEMQGELEAEKAQIGKPISYAETTKVIVDETERNALKDYGIPKILRWAGRNLHRIIEGSSKSISIRDARMINEQAGAQIIKLSAEYIDRFTVDSIILERLKHKDLSQPCKELGFQATDLQEFRKGRTQTICKEHAEKYNNYFKEMNILPQAEMFDWERIFQLALTEPISKKEKKISEHTWVAIHGKQRKKIARLPDKTKLRKWVGEKFLSICQVAQTITVKDAVLIHKISGKIIFTFNEEAVVKIPILPVHLDELEQLVKEFTDEGKKLNGKIRKKITVFRKREQNCIGRELAEKINSRFGKKVFDFGSISNQAVQEAEAEVEEMQFSSVSKKRPRVEDSSEPNSKKQRTGGETDQPMTALILNVEMRSGPDESDDPQNDSPTPLTVPPPTTPDKPVELPPKSKHDLSFLLNKKVQQ